MYTLTTLIQHNFGSPSLGYQRRKIINKRNTNCKSSKTVAVCRWHDTKHRKYPKDTTKKLPACINKSGKVSGYKTKIQQQTIRKRK